MKNKMKYFFIVCLSVWSLNTVAQTPGYLGKKNLFSIHSTPSFRILPAFGLLDSGGNGFRTYKARANGSGLDSKTKVARIDFRVGYMRVLSRKLQLGAEFGYEHMVLPLQLYTYDNFRSSSPEFNIYGGYIKVGVTSGKFIAPAGFTNTVGIGPQIYSFDQNANYYFSSDIYGDLSDSIAAFPNYGGPMWGINAFYQLSYRVLLAKFLSLELGLRLKAGVVFNGDRTSIDLNAVSSVTNSGYDPTINRAFWTKRDLKDAVLYENSFNLAQFRIGLNFVF